MTDAARQLANLHAGDGSAAVLDGVALAVAMLQKQPAHYRRAVLLISETVDQGSITSLDDALRLMSDANIAMYSFAFSSTRSAVSHEASKFDNSTPGPAHGCFSREGADPENDGHYSKQVLDCVSQLAPPLRLVTMSFLAARSALRTRTAESAAQLAGGEFFPFHNAGDLKNGLLALSNDLPNYSVLSFRPSSPASGFHTLQVEAKGRPQLALRARREYWIEEETAP
jgi:hypothetical protein